MHDRGKVLTGIVVFLVLVLFPVWFGLLNGRLGPAPAIATPTAEKRCVEATEYMRASHMRLLDRWRDDVVRGGEHVHTDPWGRTHSKSLTLTCLSAKCHGETTAKDFCVKCHDYVGASPTCDRCHEFPGGR